MNPGAVEICDGKDNDCNGESDEGCGRGPYELFDSADNDLDNLRLEYTPYHQDRYSVVAFSASSYLSTPGSGTIASVTLTLADDGSPSYSFSLLAFPFFDTTYTSVFVGGNGYLTFGASDASYAESVAQHYALPRISALFDDLPPQSGGAVYVDEFPDQVSITYDGVPGSAAADDNSFQITLMEDGRILVTYLNVDQTDGLAGVSKGGPAPLLPQETDLSGQIGQPPTTAGDLVINEFLANDDTNDSNCDGSAAGSSDEFIEIVNVSGAPLDLTGVTVEDASSVRHTFSQRGMSAGSVLLLWSGGTLNCIGIPGLTASSGSLSLDDAADSIVITAASVEIARVTYISAVANVSDTLDPDLNDLLHSSDVGPFVAHDSTNPGLSSSPGLRIDGSAFDF